MPVGLLVSTLLWIYWKDRDRWGIHVPWRTGGHGVWSFPDFTGHFAVIDD